MFLYIAQKNYIILLIGRNIRISKKYLDYTNVILKKLVVKMYKHLNINNYIFY